jgi:hypothetical protein
MTLFLAGIHVSPLAELPIQDVLKVHLHIDSCFDQLDHDFQFRREDDVAVWMPRRISTRWSGPEIVLSPEEVKNFDRMLTILRIGREGGSTIKQTITLSQWRGRWLIAQERLVTRSMTYCDLPCPKGLFRLVDILKRFDQPDE